MEAELNRLARNFTLNDSEATKVMVPKVMQNGSWSFEKELLILTPILDTEDPITVPIDCFCKLRYADDFIDPGRDTPYKAELRASISRNNQFTPSFPRTYSGDLSHMTSPRSRGSNIWDQNTCNNLNREPVQAVSQITPLCLTVNHIHPRTVLHLFDLLHYPVDGVRVGNLEVVELFRDFGLNCCFDSRMTEDLATLIGDSIGLFQESDQIRSSQLWEASMRIQFAVRSAYKLARSMNLRYSEGIEDYMSTRVMGPWNFIWLANVPPKVCMFSWKTCQNALPDCDNLIHRRVEIANSCPVCLEENEDCIHLPWGCSFTRQVCALSLIPWHLWREKPMDITS
ncbi:hypothetical protein BUALT_Bualt05G0034300 [Buddleja alternifolia]|uniref:Reverse transcriptase zinc-binding domain-containing protein n=1 Tax=Buddleja alternifolia TaxID=168488 RepID=A0AAV6XG42_9LAMI|nr:hypothetical protein BUALT_Bualt05G0034300 [Buddleja alternifolia]